MVEQTPELQVRHLRAASSAEDYAAYRAGLEWGLVDPIIIDSRDDLKSENRWKERVEPFHHQVTNLITFCRRLPVTLLADDVGLGKTISAGLIASELIARRRVGKMLIVAPKLLGPQWKEELESKFSIPTDVVTGRALVKADPAEEVGAVVTTYHSARLYIERIPKDRYQMLVLDEAHKLRNLYGVPNPPQVAQRFRDVLAERMFKYVLMLTATPIQNRLWDLYSLVELLTVARGHQNPFGASGMFIRKYIADHPTQARRLRREARDQFRAIVYGYMSRVRRGDANLHFPERNVLLRSVLPTLEESRLIEMIAGPVRKLKNRLAQISILQALTSSPHALAAQLENMGRNGTFPADVATSVCAYVKTMAPSAKLVGVGTLVDQMRAERPRNWRMVVFTHRRETQTTIQAFLEARGIRVGIINGESGLRNQQTIVRFRKDPPEVNVIVSTEAGSEGVNLQAANVLINFDLPWNPMIVEQRIGRIQRLASDFAKVFVYSVILKGTFEEYVVARLMEKLQMASHAIGDVESLLEASGLSNGEGDKADGLEEEIRRLVIDSLTGKDVEAAVRKAEASIAQAKVVLAEQEANINEMLGAMDGTVHKGPRAPTLPPIERSMPANEFARAALVTLGGEVREEGPDLYTCVLDGKSELITFADPAPTDQRRIVQIAPGTQAFDRLVGRVTQSAVHQVRDLDPEPMKVCQTLTNDWLTSFGSRSGRLSVNKVHLCYSGTALVRVRATVAHDSYERLVNVRCVEDDHNYEVPRNGLDQIPSVIAAPRAIGLDLERIARTAVADAGVAEFCRFYEERKLEEVASAGGDDRKRKRVEDEFTPRLEASLVGLDGAVYRVIRANSEYEIEGRGYVTPLTICPSVSLLVDPPALAQCAKSGRTVPESALGTCAISGTRVLKHLLVKSEFSDRIALPEHFLTCSLSGKRLLLDEVEASSVSQNLVAKSLLKTSTLSGRKAEPEHFAACKFTQTLALRSELATSEVSGGLYRPDEVAASSISGKRGHRTEFAQCALSGRTLLNSEAERCDATGTIVTKGLLEACELTGRRVLGSELEKSAVTGRPVIRSLLKASEITGARAEPGNVTHCEFTGVQALLPELARSEVSGKRCRADETARSAVSGKLGHISEFIHCALTRQALLTAEAEQCEVTGTAVMPGQLAQCSVSAKRVLPALLERSSVSGQWGLKQYFIASSISGARLLKSEGVRSALGHFCAPHEAQTCVWAGRVSHPEDLRVCELTGKPVYFSFTSEEPPRLQPLSEMLEGTRRGADCKEAWEAISRRAAQTVHGRCQVASAQVSPDGRVLAVCVEHRTLLGLRVQHAGCLYSIPEGAIVGRIALGKRGKMGWSKV